MDTQQLSRTRMLHSMEKNGVGNKKDVHQRVWIQSYKSYPEAAFSSTTSVRRLSGVCMSYQPCGQLKTSLVHDTVNSELIQCVRCRPAYSMSTH